MSTKLALSSALSVLMMASFAICAPRVATNASSAPILFGAPDRAELGTMPILPSLPALR